MDRHSTKKKGPKLKARPLKRNGPAKNVVDDFLLGGNRVLERKEKKRGQPNFFAANVGKKKKSGESRCLAAIGSAEEEHGGKGEKGKKRDFWF